MRIIIFTLLVIILTGCPSSPIQKRDVSDMNSVSMGNKFEKYFLPDLPSWANFSTVGKCQRKHQIRYLDFKQLSRSYSLNYEQSIQFQLMVNKKFLSFTQSTGKGIRLKDESYIFYNSYNQVKGGAKEFKSPNYNRIHVIWIDPILNDNGKIRALRNKLNSSAMESGYPMFMSMCLADYELEAFIEDNKFKDFSVMKISQELFNLYDTDMNKNYSYQIYLDKLLENKEIYLFTPDGKSLSNIHGVKFTKKY